MGSLICTQCGWPVEPTGEAMATLVCGYCAGRIPKERTTCYDFSPCTREDQDCSRCEWLN